MNSTFVQDSRLQERRGSKLQCHVCERRCRLVEGGAGWCRTRENRGGRLVTRTYGAVSSLSANPIEKKPFYHFYPGTFALTAGSWSCNFGCPWCQNWHISKRLPDTLHDYTPPERFVALAAELGCRGTSISFNEPTLSLEWSLEVFHLAREGGFYNTYVTNGYMTPEALALLIEAGLDAMNVDIKGDAAAVRKYCRGVDVEKVWAACRIARARGVHLELTTLVIPTVNDSEAVLCSIADRIRVELGPDVPWHLSAYHPAYSFTAPTTPLKTLERAREVGRGTGLEFVYLGNVSDTHYGNTYCPGCGTLLIRRQGYDVLLNALRGGRCPQCARAIPGAWSAC